MSLVICDRLPLPNELISLIKSYTWYDPDVSRKKYSVILQLKQARYYSGYIHIIIPYAHYSNWPSGIDYTYAFCKCGNYIKFIISSKLTHGVRCHCI